MTVNEDIYRRMSDADKAGFQARSPEGHAAKGMRIQGQEEVWIRIQHDTFKNWVNVTRQLTPRSRVTQYFRLKKESHFILSITYIVN